MRHQFAKLLHKAGMISEEESQNIPGMLSIQNLQGFKVLALPFKSTNHHMWTDTHKSGQQKGKNKTKRIQNVLLPSWNKVEEVLVVTGTLWQKSQWILPGSGSHQAIMTPPVETSAKVLILPCFLTPSMFFPEESVIASLAETIKSIVRKNVSFVHFHGSDNYERTITMG